MRRADYTTGAATLLADAPGVELGVAGTTGPSSLTTALPVGSTVTVSAPPTVVTATGTYALVSWSDGGAPTHDIVILPGWNVLEADYELLP